MTHLSRYTTAIILCVTSIPTFANSNQSGISRYQWDVHPYVGANLDLISYEKTVDRTKVIGVVGGLQFNDYLGMELNWSQSADEVKFYSGEKIVSDGKIGSYGLGATFQADLTNQLYLKSLIGVNQIKTDTTKETVNSVKFGFGYQANPDIAIELTYNSTFSKKIASSDGVGLQIKFYF